MAEPDVVAWRGELLWPQEPIAGSIIDLSEVTAIGTWLYPWFRERGQQRVVGAPRHIKQQLQRAGIPVLWYRSMQECCREDGGVSASERAMLWGDEE